MIYEETKPEETNGESNNGTEESKDGVGQEETVKDTHPRV